MPNCLFGHAGTNSGIFIFDSQTRCLLQQVRLDLDIKSLAVSETNEASLICGKTYTVLYLALFLHDLRCGVVL